MNGEIFCGEGNGGKGAIYSRIAKGDPSLKKRVWKVVVRVQLTGGAAYIGCVVHCAEAVRMRRKEMTRASRSCR
jgi:hypothetical protein